MQLKENQFNNGTAYKVSVSIRYSNYCVYSYYDNYREALDECHGKLENCREQINGYTIRKIEILPDRSQAVRVLYHRRFVPLEECQEGHPIPRPRMSEEEVAIAAISQTLHVSHWVRRHDNSRAPIQAGDKAAWRNHLESTYRQCGISNDAITANRNRHIQEDKKHY